MTEISIEYLKNLAEQLILISVFLGGISTTILGTIITHKNDSKIFKLMILGLSLAALSFIVTVIGVVKIQLVLTPDSPYQNKDEILMYPRIVSGISFYIGIFSLITVISLSGWMNSKKIGLFTTAIGVISGILIYTLT